ncbi:MAG: HD domain-containing protein [Fimbriimonadaceae bacterium]|nr:HD domain-containing protein [Fimbriimonadaceae bacterium]
MDMLRHEPLRALAQATHGTEFEGSLWVVGGAVRDELLGRSTSPDFDIVIGPSQGVNRLTSDGLVALLVRRGLAETAPALYEQFGTAMLHVAGSTMEFVAARKESYRGDSRKPTVEPATLLEDARRRDFTCNALLFGLHGQGVADPLGVGLADLEARTLRTPLDPAQTFSEDPLRMLRAVRFRHQLGFDYAVGLAESIRQESHRLAIISRERIRDELQKMLLLAVADRALADLLHLGLLIQFAPICVAMAGVQQGGYHHLDVWEHSLLVVRNAGVGDLILTLSALLHDVGKPPTAVLDERGVTRFFSHEVIGAEMSHAWLLQMRFSGEIADRVARLVKNHMRLGSSPTFTPTAARRVIRDMGSDLERLLALVEADAASLRPGVRRLDLTPIRRQIEAVQRATPLSTLVSPLSGREIMDALGLEPGPEVGRAKAWLLEQVLEGKLTPGDKQAAVALLKGTASPPRYL